MTQMIYLNQYIDRDRSQDQNIHVTIRGPKHGLHCGRDRYHYLNYHEVLSQMPIYCWEAHNKQTIILQTNKHYFSNKHYNQNVNFLILVLTTHNIFYDFSRHYARFFLVSRAKMHQIFQHCHMASFRAIFDKLG